MEGFASKDNSLWSNTGFLAGWVASKAQLGEVDAAWRRGLASYDHNPMIGPEECTIALPVERCPNERLLRLERPHLRSVVVANQSATCRPLPSRGQMITARPTGDRRGR